MEPVPAAAVFPEFSFSDCLAATFCQPCVYGSGLARVTRFDRTGQAQPEGLFPDTTSELAVILGTCAIGGIVPCLTGIYLRSMRSGATEHIGNAILAEWCVLCSCAPCQMNQFRNGKTQSKELLLQ